MGAGGLDQLLHFIKGNHHSWFDGGLNSGRGFSGVLGFSANPALAALARFGPAFESVQERSTRFVQDRSGLGAAAEEFAQAGLSALDGRNALLFLEAEHAPTALQDLAAEAGNE